MLESLYISNYALIDNLDIDFEPGLNVITGETGAGKSIILGALSLILGGRADTKAVGDPTRKSVIEATFRIGDNDKLRQLCKDTDIDPADGDDDIDTLIMRREIVPAGRSRAFINDSPVPVAKLQELAIHLVDIHSQHQNLLLAQPKFQLDIIDSLAGNGALKEEYQKAYATLREAVRKLKKARRDLENSRSDEEYTRYQLQQLEELQLIEGEQADLEHERDIQANLAGIKTALHDALQALTDGDGNALSLLDTAAESIESLEGVVNPSDNIAQRLENSRLEIQDIADTLSAIDSNLQASPAELEDIEQRLNTIYSMQHRHHVDSVEELIALRDNMRATLDALDNSDTHIAELEKHARRALAIAREAAEALSASRRRCAESFAVRLRERAVPLGMKNLQCEIAVSPTDLSSTGADNVEFLFSFNKNQPLMPVGKTASGGEISRLMLSIKAIIAEHMQLPSLILDEIDTGVSGDVAHRMGCLMESIAGHSQVITITHLPQVASKGSVHLKVYKEDDADATHTRLRRLNADERVGEIALMLSGDAANAEARATAATLLDS